jgi:glucose/arabinose dehydrogenase
MKLSDYAKEKGISYVTAFRHWKNRLIVGKTGKKNRNREQCVGG